MAVPDSNQYPTDAGSRKNPSISIGEKKPFDPTRLPAEALINTREVAEWTGLAIVTLEKWRLERKGPPFVRCESAVRYRVGDVRQWLQSGNGSREVSAPAVNTQST